jgi:hypothetical protein
MVRMMSAGARTSAPDRREFQRMRTEKTAAFTESWVAMYLAAFRINQEIALSMLRLWWNPWLAGAPSSLQYLKRMQNATVDIATKGIAPIRKRAVANARRLKRSGRR